MKAGVPLADAPFLEWTSTPVEAGGRRLLVLARGPGGLHGAGTGCCAVLRAGGAWQGCGEDDPLLRKGVSALLPTAAGGLWAGVGGGLAHWRGASWTVTDEAFARGWGGALALAAQGDRLWAGFSGGVLARRCLLPAGPGLEAQAQLPAAVRALVPLAGGLLAATDAGLHLVPEGGAPRRLAAVPARALLPWPGGWLCGTADGLLAVDAAGGCRTAPLDAGLPVRDIRALSASPGGPLWAATGEGLLRHACGEWHYHQGPRWLPSDAVYALAADSAGVQVATGAGLCRLSARPTTLERRAGILLSRLRERHLRLGSFVAETVEGTPVPSDNDGLWTGLYLAAECHRFAATAAPDARANADAAFAALEWLEEVTTIPGYPTKALVAADTPRPGDGDWYPSADGRWWWKGNCSSDEIVGHMYACALYFDLVAGPAQRRRVAALVDRVLGAILDNGLRLLEFGRRTRWGYWDPETVNGPACTWGDRGLNSLEILSHLRVAEHVTGEPRYGREYARLVGEHGYAQNTLLCKVDIPGHVNHSDDELAFLAYAPLLAYERDPGLRALYLESLRRSWEAERAERNPLWNLIHAAALGGAGVDLPGELAAAVRSLREIPTDTVLWPVRNSGRADVVAAPRPDRHGVPEITRVLPYDELALARWNGNPHACDGGDPRVEGDGVHFLLPYWLGRHLGWIAPGE